MNKKKYEKIAKLLFADNPDIRQRKFYYKDFLLEKSDQDGLYFVNNRVVGYSELVSALIMIDVLASDEFTKTCFLKHEVPFIHSEIFRDGYF